jgi:hypothetical protein
VAIIAIRRARPRRHQVEARNNAQPLLTGVADDHIGTGPVEAVAAAGLYVAPRKQIDDPARAHFAHQRQRCRDMGFVADACQPRMHARLSVARNNGLLRRQVQRARQTRRQKLHQRG